MSCVRLALVRVSVSVFFFLGGPPYSDAVNFVFCRAQAILEGPRQENFNKMCVKHTHRFVDLMAGSLRPLVQHMMGEEEFTALKDDIAKQMIENLPMAIR